jgi:hypothetical protein
LTWRFVTPPGVIRSRRQPTYARFPSRDLTVTWAVREMLEWQDRYGLDRDPRLLVAWKSAKYVVTGARFTARL